MATRIKLRRDTATRWQNINPVLSLGEPGVETNTGKMKIGDGTSTWNTLDYFAGEGGITDRLSASGDEVILVGGANPYVTFPAITGGDQLIIQGAEVSSVSGQLALTSQNNLYIIANASGTAPGGSKSWTFGSNGVLALPPNGDIVNSTGTSVLGGGSISVLDEFDIETSNVTAVAFSSGFNISSPEPGLVTVELTGDGLPTVTVPGEVGSTYKGLQVSYGMVHSNTNSNELNVNKIVIHKPAQTITEIDTTSSQDYFRVSGLGSSDVLAMFVIYGDVNGAKPLTTLQTFAQSVIDNVILDGGVEGQYQSVADMKAAFYDNYPSLASAAGGLDLDFQFHDTYVNATTGVTTTRQGTGATFDITVTTPGSAYVPVVVDTAGANYRVGHKIKVLGTDLEGLTPDNDLVITVTSVDAGGAITGISTVGDSNAGATMMVYNRSGSNYQVGSGCLVAGVGVNPSNGILYTNLNAQGSGYVVGDVLTLLGSDLQSGASPANDITLIINSVDGNGALGDWTVTGTMPTVWPTNNIGDGGNDQYDGANYINSSLAEAIAYNNGNIVLDGTTKFGAGSSYTFVYDTGIFGLLVTGNSATSIGTGGNSGADGNSTTEAGNIFGPSTDAQTFDNAVTHLNLVGDAYAGAVVSFVRPDDSNETIDILIPDDGDGAGVAIARDSNGNGIFNPYREADWNNSTSPAGIGWNIDGWNDLSNVTTREYVNLYAAFGNGGLGNKIVGTECVIYLPDNGKYYAVKFSSWTQGGNGGGFAYTRRELDLSSLQEGIRFADGTRLKSAEGIGRVKLESPGARRIEEVHGYKSVAVTARETTTVTFTASRTETNTQWFWFDRTTSTVDDIINQYPSYGIDSIIDMEFSVDNTTWYPWNGSGTSAGNENAYSVFPTTVSYNQGDTLYFRYAHGAQPVVWWNAADLPGGSSNFRGAVIDYHAYTGDGTIVGTIHIVDDDGEENITHTEVASGGSDNENDDLWLVQNEGTISYRRIDKQAKTLKIQWTAKVFYGSEIYD